MSDDDELLNQVMEEVNDNPDDLLDTLLSVATEESKTTKNTLKETNIFEKETNLNVPKVTGSLIHAGDTDSSDDEDNRNYEEQKYNQSGRSLKKLLDENTSSSSTSSPTSYFRKPEFKSNSLSTSWKTPKNTLVAPSTATKQIESKPSQNVQGKVDVHTDPIFGLRIVNPLVSSQVLRERMVGREAVPFARLSLFIQRQFKDKDWVIAGVIANKSAAKTSQKGSQFCIWTLTDLKTEIKTVSLFLFSGAYKNLWKTSVGTIVGVLNPNVMDKKEGSKDEATLSVDNAQKVMILGQSKDLGTCRSTRKNGEQCTAIVNLSICEYCMYHIKQEYQKCSKRSELQSNFQGKGLTALRNKVLGKNEVFYAGKSFTAVPAKRSRKLEKKDESRMQSLSKGYMNSPTVTGPRKKVVANNRLEVSLAQRTRDMELLKKLSGDSKLDSKTEFSGERSSDLTLEESKSTATSIISKLKAKNKELQPPQLTSKYDMKSDLIVNVDGKSNFKGKVSSEVSLESSKATAQNVISKLKGKTQDKKVPTDCGNEKENVVTDIFGEDDFDFDYDDDDLVSQNKKHKSISSDDKQNKIKVTNTTDITKSSVPPNITQTKLKDNANQKESTQTTQKPIPNKTPTTTTTPKLTTNRSFLSDPVTSDKPKLSGWGSGSIDLNQPISFRQMNKAKQNALKYIQQHGPIKKIDPNNTKGTGLKRKLEEVAPSVTKPLNDATTIESAPKKVRIEENAFISDRFKKMMAMTSKHTDLLEQKDNEEQEKYFNKLELKEKMEEKMANTFKIACKAVTCTVCKYTSFSAAELCKTERHKLKVTDAMKRFFKCGNCEKRTASLEIYPTKLCENCGSGKWLKTGMIKEKIVTVSNKLSVLGGEQKFVNSAMNDSNIDLLVPDD